METASKLASQTDRGTTARTPRPWDARNPILDAAPARRTGRTSRVTAMTFVALSLFALTELLPETIDLTRTGAFTLAPQTRNVLQHLKQPVRIALLAPRVARTAGERQFAMAVPFLRDLISQMQSQRRDLELIEIDPADSAQGRELLARFPEASPPCVVVSYADRHEVLYAPDLVRVHAPGAGRPPVVEFFGEAALSAALSRLSSGGSQAIVYFLGGHGELRLDDLEADSRLGIGLLARRLRELDFEVRPLDLRSEPRVPMDAGIVLIAGGESPPAMAEVEALARYLAHGGNALVLCDTYADPLTGHATAATWQPLLAEYGVRLGTDRVVTQGFTGQLDAASPGVPAKSGHVLVRSLPLAPVILFECRSVCQINDVGQSPWTFEPLLVSYPAPEAWAEGDDGDDPAPGGENDTDGPVAMAAAVERRRGGERQPALAVVGDAEFLSNHALSQPAGRSGLAFALSCLNWLRGRNDLMGDIPPRQNEGYVLPGTPEQQRGLVWKPTLLLCAMVISGGVTVWVSRRE